MIKESAHRHGITDDEIEHAITNVIRVWDMDDFDMLIGPKPDGSLIEVGVNRDGDVFHAMPARTKFL